MPEIKEGREIRKLSAPDKVGFEFRNINIQPETEDFDEFVVYYNQLQDIATCYYRDSGYIFEICLQPDSDSAGDYQLFILTKEANTDFVKPGVDSIKVLKLMMDKMRENGVKVKKITSHMSDNHLENSDYDRLRDFLIWTGLFENLKNLNKEDLLKLWNANRSSLLDSRSGFSEKAIEIDDTFTSTGEKARKAVLRRRIYFFQRFGTIFINEITQGIVKLYSNENDVVFLEFKS